MLALAFSLIVAVNNCKPDGIPIAVVVEADDDAARLD